jgi:signal transduction histidine kinase
MIRSKRFAGQVIECASMPSLRSRAAYNIAVSYGAVFAWTILLLGAAVYFAVDAEMGRDRDREIVGELDRLSSKSTDEVLREVRWRAEHGAANRFQYAVFDDRGTRIAGALDVEMPMAFGLGDVSLKGQSDKNLDPIRLGMAETEAGGRLVVSTEASAEDGVIRSILKYFLAAFVAMIVVSVASGWILAWYLRKRLRPISETANAIVTGDLDFRVPISGRGDEFDSVGVAFNLMLDRVARLMENLRQVSSDIAHDLRKPLIRLLNQADRLGRAEGAEDRLLEIGDEMLALFAAILRIAEVEGGNLERSFEKIDLSELMIEVAESFEPALADAGNSIEWRVEPNIAVVGNKELLAQLAANLLDNARIHTPAGTNIRLILSSDEQNARLSVEDNGPGVDEADRQKVLQRFFRADASRTTPGNGLGLSLVAAAAHAHGGEVTVEDADPGFRVCMTLPRLREDPKTDQSPRPEGGWRSFWRRSQ